MIWLDKLVEWYQQHNYRHFEDDVKLYIKKNFDITDWNKLTQEEQEDWKDFYTKEMNR